MQLVFHGGKCCGIKTIHSLGTDPQSTTAALAKKSIDNADQYGHPVKSDQRFFHMDAPKETFVERLDRYLAYLSSWRPRGMVEITLCERPDKEKGYGHQADWFPILKERGFKLVMRHPNSNSGNIVRVYYLGIGDPADTSEDTELSESELEEDDE